MGYRSQVVLAISKHLTPFFTLKVTQNKAAESLVFADADTFDRDYGGDKSWLMVWDGIKWYDSDDVISDLIKFIDALDAGDLSDYGLGDDEKWCDHFNFVRIGEDYEDVESKGWGFDSIGMTREISY